MFAQRSFDETGVDTGRELSFGRCDPATRGVEWDDPVDSDRRSSLVAALITEIVSASPIAIAHATVLRRAREFLDAALADWSEQELRACVDSLETDAIVSLPRSHLISRDARRDYATRVGHEHAAAAIAAEISELDVPPEPHPPMTLARTLFTHQAATPTALQRSANAAAHGNPEAREAIALGAARIVRAVARRYHPAGAGDIEDVMQLGFVGLIEATATYRGATDGPFATYAKQRVRDALSRASDPDADHCCSLDDTHDVADHRYDPGALVDASTGSDEIEQLLAALSPVAAELVRAWAGLVWPSPSGAFLGHPFHVVAWQFDLTPAAAQQECNAALAQLQQAAKARSRGKKIAARPSGRPRAHTVRSLDSEPSQARMRRTVVYILKIVPGPARGTRKGRVRWSDGETGETAWWREQTLLVYPDNLIGLSEHEIEIIARQSRDAGT